MSDRPHVVGIVGSFREASYTRLILETALSGAERAGGTSELLDLCRFDLPPLNPDIGKVGASERFTDRVRDADSILLGTPMYHGSYSGVLKNALDYCGFDEFENKTVGLLAVSGGNFPITALEHLRSVCRALNAWVIPHQAAVPNVRKAFEDGAYVDSRVESRVLTLGQRAVTFARIEPDPASFESEENVGASE